jgi:hypothetical protein
VCLCFGKKTAAQTRLDKKTYTALTKSQRQNKKFWACYSFNMSCPGNCDYISAKKCRDDLKHTAPAWNVDPAGPKSRTDLSSNKYGAKYTQEFWDKGPYMGGTYLTKGALKKAKDRACAYTGRHYGLLLLFLTSGLGANVFVKLFAMRISFVTSNLADEIILVMDQINILSSILQIFLIAFLFL